MVPARHLTAPSPAPEPPSLRTAVIASAAAIGAVATGTFTALLPTPGDGTTTTAAADEYTANPTLAAMSIRIPSTATAVGTLTLVDHSGFAASDQHLSSLGKATDIAAELAEKLAAEKAAQAERARIDAIVAKGGVDGWIAEALRILDLPQSLAPGVKKIIMAESGGNPRAINNWDSNARRGTPSQGLMQTIPSTFNHYVAPELADRPITDPVANITAGLRYMIDNYGLETVEAGGRSNSSGGYIGY
jgi:Transglycosylase SLT domain